MEPDIPPAPFLAAFAGFVHQQRAAIGSQWMALVRESPDVPDAMRISHQGLEDHVPELIDDLVDRLRLEKEEPKELTADHSRSHGREQWKAGYNISELIWGIYIIRRILTQSVLGEFASAHPEYSLEERAQAESLMHDFFHRLTCDSAGQFIEEQQRLIHKKNQALQQTNEARERLTRTVSHELRNVLNALTLANMLLGDETDEVERRGMATVCSRMLSDMSHILNDMLDFSALMAGRAQLTLARFSLKALFGEVVSQWKSVAEERGMSFASECDPSLGEIVSDHPRDKKRPAGQSS